MRTAVVLYCLFAVCYGFTAKRLLLDLGRLRARELTPDLAQDIGVKARGLLSRASAQLQKRSYGDDKDFIDYVMRTARELSKDQFQAKMTEKCGGKGSTEYIDAQAVANDVVFEYTDSLPADVHDDCLEAAVYYNVRFRADILEIDSGVPDICNDDYEGKVVNGTPNGQPWIGKDAYCNAYKEING